MSTIRNTIESALNNDPSVLRSYGTYIDRVVTALEEREERAIESLISGGVNLGASENQIEGLLIDAGLRTAPEPEVPAEPQSVEAQIASLTEQVRVLTETVSNALTSARRQGVSI